jgi:hypothetical protein
MFNSKIKSEFKKKIEVAFCISAPIIIIGYSISYYQNSWLCNYVISFSTLILLIYISSLFSRKTYGKFSLYLVYVFSITFFLLEITTMILLYFGIIRQDMRFWFGGFKATDSKLFSYDRVSGCRYMQGSHRYISARNGIVEMDIIMKVNNQGWFSEKDYSYKKNQNIKRYVVFGDSFSCGIVVSTTWSDIVQQNWNLSGQDSIEIYNFSIDGGGIVNWHRTFFYEIVQRYEFDGIIIAPSFEKDGIPDLDRKFLIAHSDTSYNYYYAIDVLNDEIPTTFPQKYAAPGAPIYSNSALNEMAKYNFRRGDRQHFFEKANLLFLSTFYEATDGVYKMIDFSRKLAAYEKPHELYYDLSDSIYKIEYFEKRYKYGFMLKDIIRYCKEQNKAIALISIPDYEHALDYINGKSCIYRNEIKFLSENFGTDYFDGFTIFNNRDAVFIKSCYYEFDKHLNNKGINLFAEKVIESKLLK